MPNSGVPSPSLNSTLTQRPPLPLTLCVCRVQLWYPVADHLENSSMPDSGVPPRSLPEFSATVTANGIPVNMVMMTVNGRTYPRQVRSVFFVDGLFLGLFPKGAGRNQGSERPHLPLPG